MLGGTKRDPNRVWDFVFALSLANLCCLGGWIQIERSQLAWDNYFRKQPLTDSFLVAHFLTLLLGALGMFAILGFLRYWNNSLAFKIAECAFLLLLAVPLHALNKEFLGLTSDHLVVMCGRAGLILVGATLGTGPFLIALYRNRVVFRAAKTAVLILAPLLPVLAASSVVDRFAGPPQTAFADKTPAALLPPRPAGLPRVVWIVFDELDERLAYLERPATVTLPELDRLAGQSVRARNAYPPSTATMVSLPSLITGRLIAQARPTGANDLAITFSGTKASVRWSSQPNVFSRARKQGANTALVGWHNPYCRIIGSDLSACAWEENMTMSGTAGEYGVAGTSSAEMRFVASSIPLLPKFGSIRPDRLDREQFDAMRRQHQEAYFGIRAYALADAADPRLDLVFLHFPVPHPFGIYNRAKSSFDDIGHSSYLDNLALTDRTLGEVRRAMEIAGLWDKSIVLVTADHPLRPYEWNHRTGWTKEDEAAVAGKESPLIPFLLKLPGQRDARAYEPAFNTVLSHDLVLAALRGEISTPDKAARWLDRNRGRFPVH